MWVFGYGSLIWKVDFPYETKITGYIKGYSRRFYQHSTDHRGTPDKPGRVVTLIPSNEEDKVYGIAYKIQNENIDFVIKHLDYREKGGYKRTPVIFYPKDAPDKSFEITIYLANNDNPQYAGYADNSLIAQQIVESVGPSGTNIEYICNLAKTMKTIAPEVNDQHLFELEEKVLNLIEKTNEKSCSQIINANSIDFS